MSTPLRVAYIGNFEPAHSTENHVLRSLRSIPDVEVTTWQEDEHWNEVDAANGLAPSLDLDFVLWTHTHGLGDESKHDAQTDWLERCADIGLPTVGYHLDRWWGLERASQVLEPFFAQALVVTADGGHQAEWETLGVNHRWLPPAIVHDEVGAGTPGSKYRKDVGFVGGWFNYGHAELWPWRYEMIKSLSKRYQSRFRAWPRGAAIRGRELNDLYASVRVVVGDSCLAPKDDGSPMTHYWSDRVPETLGRGGLLLHPDVEGLDEWFPIELPIRFTWGDKASLYEAVDYALALDVDEREFKIGQAIDFVREKHTYRVRMLQVIDWVKELRNGNDVAGTTSAGGEPAHQLDEGIGASALRQEGGGDEHRN